VDVSDRLMEGWIEQAANNKVASKNAEPMIITRSRRLF
jgi:hypothetical protein